MSMPLQVRTDPPSPEDIRAQYGFVAMIAEEIPEIGDLMQEAVDGNWTADRFSLALANTEWWRTTYSGQREWLVQQIADPATAELSLQNGAREVLDMASRLGLPTPDYRDARKIWLTMQTRGMDAAAQQAHLSRALLTGNLALDSVGGIYGQHVNDMYKIAGQYGYRSPTINDEIQELARFIMHTGAAGNTEAWRSKMIEYAAAKYQPFADRLRGGETVLDIARPYLESYSQVLELNPHDIGLDDQMMQKALQGDGTQAQTVWQFEQQLRQDERYGYTNGARRQAAQVLEKIGTAFGMVA